MFRTGSRHRFLLFPIISCLSSTSLCVNLAHNENIITLSSRNSPDPLSFLYLCSYEYFALNETMISFHFLLFSSMFPFYSFLLSSLLIPFCYFSFLFPRYFPFLFPFVIFSSYSLLPYSLPIPFCYFPFLFPSIIFPSNSPILVFRARRRFRFL